MYYVCNILLCITYHKYSSTKILTILFIFRKMIFILIKSYQDNCQGMGSNSWPSAIKAIVLSTPPWGTHWAKPKIMSSAYKCRSNLPKQVVGMARIGNAHDMPIIFNATKHQNVWANMPKNPEGLKCQRRQYLMFNFDPKNL